MYRIVQTVHPKNIPISFRLLCLALKNQDYGGGDGANVGDGGSDVTGENQGDCDDNSDVIFWSHTAAYF